MRKNRQYSREFKLAILRELETKRMVEICRMNNLSPSTVSGWKKDFSENSKEAFKGKGNLWKEEAKIAQYERKIGQQAMEIDFLKKVYESLKQHMEEEKIKSM